MLKDNLENVRRGRFRAVRGQMGYKLPALLEARATTDSTASEVLFGDDVEADALVYSVYADAIAGRIGAAEVSRVMERAGAYEDEVERALEALAQVHRSDAVERIFIRSERGVPTRRMAALGPRVVPIRSWWQAGVVLHAMGHVEAVVAVDVLKRVYELEGRDAWSVGALTQDLLRRGVVDASFLLGLSLPDELRQAMAGAVSAMGGRGFRAQAEEQPAIDYLQLLASGEWNKHGKADTRGSNPLHRHEWCSGFSSHRCAWLTPGSRQRSQRMVTTASGSFPIRPGLPPSFGSWAVRPRTWVLPRSMTWSPWRGGRMLISRCRSPSLPRVPM